MSREQTRQHLGTLRDNWPYPVLGAALLGMLGAVFVSPVAGLLCVVGGAIGGASVCIIGGAVVNRLPVDRRSGDPLTLVTVNDAPLSDAAVQQLIVTMCLQGGQHQPPPDIAAVAVDMLDADVPPRAVGAWLLAEMATRHRSCIWLERALSA